MNSTAVVSTKDLANLIKSVREAAGRDDLGHPLPLVLRWGAGCIHGRVRSQSLCIAANAKAECEGAAGPVNVELQHLDKTVQALTSHTVTLTLDADAMRLQLKSGAFKSSITAMPAEGGPPREDATAPLVDVPAGVVRELLRATTYAMAHDQTRAVLCGVQLVAAGDTITATATDGHRLARFSLDAEGISRVIQKATVLNGVGAAALLGLASRETPSMLRLSVQHNNLVAVADGDVPVTLHAAILDGRFPDVEAVIPQSHATEMRTGPALLSENVKRVSGIQHGTSASENFRIDVHAEGARLTCSDPTTGEATDDHLAPVSGPPVTIGVNSRYFQDALKQLSGADQISVRFGDSLSAVHLTAGNHAAVIMPVRI
jgi:DNA polymerase-3 subunit beta